MGLQKSVHEGVVLQWHPALYAGIQIEFENEAENLIFENEHQLGTKPMEIDILIIKKETEKPIQKNIGRIFRKYNIIEYKSPTDYLCIDDFYKVFGYAYFYKADTKMVNEIKVSELTITFISDRYPRQMLSHLKKVHKMEIIKAEAGIYYLKGNIIPMQLIVQRELSKDENLWLGSLTDKLNNRKQLSDLVNAYNNRPQNKLYESVMDMIIRANRKRFKEENIMCDALQELIQEIAEEKAVEMAVEIAEKLAAEKAEKLAAEKAEKLAAEKAEKLATEKVEKLATEKAEKLATERTEKNVQRLNELIIKLVSLGRVDEFVHTVGNSEEQKKLFEEFGL